ncbi:MAG TPA: hypothetical protein ENI87_08395 [bacterium]|nr:hypothetical protein [bacterium]
MERVPTPDEVRALVQPLDELDRKVLGGLLALWMSEPARVRDREWTSQAFVQVATVAHGFDAEDGPATTEDVERIRRYAAEHMQRVVRVGLSLFVRVAHDLQDRAGGFGLDSARECVRSYLE